MEGSDHSDSINNNNDNVQSPPPPPPPPPQEDVSLENHSSSSSERQNSIFSITLDELHSRSVFGRSYGDGSLNFEDLIVGGGAAIWNGGVAPPAATAVEEVWSEVNRKLSHDHEGFNFNRMEINNQEEGPEEMTLEDFLVRAGVIREPPRTPAVETFNSDGFPANNDEDNNMEVDTPAPPPAAMGYKFSATRTSLNYRMDGTRSMYQVLGQNGGLEGETSRSVGNNGSKVNNEVCTKSRGRTASHGGEVVGERKQRRMIKNRESAARSRARKQAYTAELEIELNNLKDENARLKFALAEAKHKQKESTYPPTKAQRMMETLKKIRRTSSMTW